MHAGRVEHGDEEDAAGCQVMGVYLDPQCNLPLFRSCDPATSQAAGRRAEEFVSKHERTILAALAQGPGTKDEIASRCGLSEQQVVRRRAGMLRKQLVVLTGELRPTPSGCMAEVWMAKECQE
jgi:DNA-binding NarL/FixJ family response regulator